MTKTEPVERSLSWFPCPADWTRHPLCRRLRKADKANPDRWMHLVSEAHRCKNDGRLQMADGTILAVEDLAYDHDREDEEWEAFISLCEQLGLVARDSDGCVVVAKWSNWNRKAAHNTEARKLQKRAERATHKAEALEAQIAAERAAHEAQIAEVRAYLNSPTSPATPATEEPSQGPVATLSQICRNPVVEMSQDVVEMSQDVVDLDETRLDLDKDKSKSNSARVRGRKATIPPLSLRPAIGDRSQRFSEDTNFDSRIRASYQKLLAKPLAGRDEEETFTSQLRPPWSKFAAGARADAIEQAAAAIGPGADPKLWRNVLAAALELLEQARARPDPDD